MAIGERMTKKARYSQTTEEVPELVKRRWSELLGELLDMIESHLTLYIDKVRIRAVCTSWYSHLPKLPNQQLRQLPWLLQEYENDEEASHGLFDPLEKKFYHLDLPEAKGKLFKASSHGWVLTIEDITSTSPADIYLINPLTRARIQLPPRSTFPDVKYYDPNKVGEEYALLDGVEFYFTNQDHLIHLIDKVVLSSTPTSDDCVVVAIYGECRRLAFCKCNDEKWTHIHLPKRFRAPFADIKFYKQKLYAVTGCRALIVIDDIGPNPKVTKIVLSPKIFNPLPAPVYLVESSNGDLLMVTRTISILEGKFPYSIVETSDFQIYKLDYSSSNWVEVKSIGEDMLFLGYNSSVAISSLDDFPGYKGNCIYYTDGPQSFGGKSHKQECSDIGVFELDEEMFNEIPGFKCDSKLLWPPPVWLMPPSLY